MVIFNSYVSLPEGTSQCLILFDGQTVSIVADRMRLPQTKLRQLLDEGHPTCPFLSCVRVGIWHRMDEGCVILSNCDLLWLIVINCGCIIYHLYYDICLVIMCNQHHVRRIDFQHQSHTMMMHTQQNCIIQSIGSFITKSYDTRAFKPRQCKDSNPRFHSSRTGVAGMGLESIAVFLRLPNSPQATCGWHSWHTQSQSPVHPMAILAMLGPSVGIVHGSIHQKMVDLQPGPWRPWSPWRPWGP